MDISDSRYFITINDSMVTAVSPDGNAHIGGCLDTDIPFEDHSFTELIAMMRERIASLVNRGAGYILADSCKSLRQARAAVFACRKEKVGLIICLDCDEDGETPYGDNAAACLIALQELGLLAFGVSGELTPGQCTKVLDLLVPFAKIPLVAAPTAGEPNPLIPELYDLAPQKMADSVLPLLDRGVTMLAENDGVTEQHAALLKRELFSYDASGLRLEREDEEDNIILSNNRDFFVINDERLEFTEPILCSQDMADKLIAAEEESYDVLLIRIESADDALVFEDNAHLAALPVMFSADNEIALKAALMLYDGRAMIDSESAIKEDALEKIAAKYGSLIY